VAEVVVEEAAAAAGQAAQEVVTLHLPEVVIAVIAVLAAAMPAVQEVIAPQALVVILTAILQADLTHQ
jgi:Tfp pilus assembly major pilin PilA